MDRELVINKLAAIGLDPSLVGFYYIADMLEILPSMPIDGDSMSTMYMDIAAKHNTSASSIERSVRYAIERFYSSTLCESPMLIADINKGKCTNKQFLYKLRVMLKEETGHFSDGRVWALRERSAFKYDVLVYACGGCYTAYVGSHDACINFILNGGNAHAV